VLITEAPTDAMFGVRHDLRDGFVRLFVRGELDLVTAPVLEDELAAVERLSDPIVVDLRDLSFMDCSGLRALVARGGAPARRAAGSSSPGVVPLSGGTSS
jgi:anti-anti-sigma factor